MAVSRTRAGDLVDSPDKTHAVAQVNFFLEEAGRGFELQVAALETPLEFQGGPIGLDGRKA